MCGIAGYIGNKNACDVIINQLKKIEYRGYDSVGLSVLGEKKIVTVKTVGKVVNLEKLLQANEEIRSSSCGFGHTRWATHGGICEKNAHPHFTNSVSVVHNGIIENADLLKNFLKERGIIFKSETDTEVITNLLDYFYDKNPEKTIYKVVDMLKGSYALGILFSDISDKLFAIRKDSSLVIGAGDNENLVCSDLNAILEYTNKYYILEENELAVLCKENITFLNVKLEQISKQANVANWNETLKNKQNFEHFMLKEIFEQPNVLESSTLRNVKNGLPDFSVDDLDDNDLKRFKKIYIVACGTALYAGLVGKTWIEKFAKIPVEVAIASEFRYSDPLLTDDTLVLVISQSGETADTIAAVKLAKSQNIYTLGIINTKGSTMSRDVDKVIYTVAGNEIAVASTKAYSAQLNMLYLLSLKLSLLNKKFTEEQVCNMNSQFMNLPALIKKFLISKTKEIENVANNVSSFDIVLYIGRGLDYLLSLEGALKLKEISYVNAQSYAAGELKHGPLSLITNETLVIGIASQEKTLEKFLSNVQEVKARGGKVLLIYKDGMAINNSLFDYSISVNTLEDDMMPFLVIVVLQLIAYYAAKIKGLDVDKPRNLAKSVTVE